ncbi:MAG: hypothetical protein JKY31_02310 [Rhodobacteraceae bacterium]|nr:hypothetical protein [Paracoccaceae bacterium]
MTFRILGASHANALRFAYELNYVNHPKDLQIRGVAALKNFYEPFHTFDGKEIRFTNPDIVEGFKMSFGTDVIRAEDRIWGIVTGFTSVRLWGAWCWSNGYSPSMDDPGNKYHVTNGMLRGVHSRLNAGWFQFLKDLRQLDLRVVLISSPPPIPTHPSLQVGFDPDVAMHIHEIAADHWQEFADANGIESVRVPTRVCDEKGFLLPEYFIDDGIEDFTHGNIDYGEALLAEVLEIL